MIWAAGVTASPLARQLGETDRAGRIAVTPELEVVGRPGIYALGDIALFHDTTGNPLPCLAQVAKQHGIHLGRGLAARITDGASLQPFVYPSLGNIAIIGRHAAVYETEGRQVTGWAGWMLWAIVHVHLLVGVENRVAVSFHWLWRYLTYHRGARLISSPSTEFDPSKGPAQTLRTSGNSLPDS